MLRRLAAEGLGSLLLAATVIGFMDLWRDTVTGPFLPWRYRSSAPVSDATADTAGEVVAREDGVTAQGAGAAAHQTAGKSGADPAVPAGSSPS